MLSLQPVPTWSAEQTRDTFSNGTFHDVIGGVEIQKSADDLQRYRELVEISQPDIVIETGTRAGGSALWFHRELNLQVVTIDVRPQFLKKGGPPYRGPGIEWMVGSSIVDHVVNAALTHLGGKRVMVSLDSDHHSPHVQAEMSIWGQFVSPGCYMVVEDGCFDMFHRLGNSDHARVGGQRIPEYGGPLDAIEKSGIALSSEWWRDESLEALTPISHSPVGWWRKHD